MSSRRAAVLVALAAATLASCDPILVDDAGTCPEQADAGMGADIGASGGLDGGVFAAAEATLIASDGATDDLFGRSVALSADGSRALVGAVLDATPSGAEGSARVFLRTGTTWSEETTLFASGGFGISVALSADGSLALVGANSATTAAGVAAGSAHVFLRTGTRWGVEATLLAWDGEAFDEFGTSVALSVDGSRALVGVGRDETAAGWRAGSARVFLRTGTSWSEEATLLASGARWGDEFGSSVALSADASRALIGAPVRDATGESGGSARVFARIGTTWSEEATLRASDGAPFDGFGSAVALAADGSRAVVSAPGDGTVGSARAFVRTGTCWREEAILVASAGAEGDGFGFSVALSADGSRALVGSPEDDVAPDWDVGSASVFVRIGTTWTETATLLAPGRPESDSFGIDVALSADGERALVGAYFDDTAGGTDAGSATIFLLGP